MIEGAHSKKLDALVGRSESSGESPGATPPAPEGVDPIVHELVYAFLLWEAGAKLAGEALRAIQDEFVDYNEARIGMSDELAELLPPRYPLAAERCQRLRFALNTVFKREHALSLNNLADLPKRDGRAYLDSIEGMTPFVAARVSLLSLGVHAFPIDARLAQVLADAGVCDADEDPASLTSRLERYYRAGQAAPAYLALEHASLEETKKPKSASRSKSTAKAPAGKAAGKGASGKGKGTKSSKSKTKAP